MMLADPTNPEPSLVVHVRNLNPRATEADLIEALETFGLIAYVAIIPAQKMALVEFEDIEAARACVTFASSNFIFVAGYAALFNYSTSQNIQRHGFESESPCKVLVITVYNAQYPIDVHVIHQICEPHGKVLRIAIVRKSLMQALVEFENAEIARKVKHAISGADIYSGCCTLKVEFAKPDHIKVTRQDNDQFDFTLPYDSSSHNYEHRQRKTLLPGGGPSPCPGNGLDYGSRNGYNKPYASGGSVGCVLMVYGIEREKINCQMLFNLFCQYGNVLRIKFMAAKKDTAMAELGTSMAVTDVLHFLQGASLFGLSLQLELSRQTCIRDDPNPFDMPDGSPSFRDFSMSALQRFSTPAAAARNRLIFPTNILHWYNAPVNMDEAKIRQLFAEKNAPEPKSVTVFTGRSERSSSGIVEMKTIEQSNEALALLNHTPVMSPLNKMPYIIKLAYATLHKRSGVSIKEEI
ncbi:unnamed protein product [Cylicocyclus nassatus]|uniref:RRM domain-containing protein n=1 Tax=Cylicocyclus nassatus TaxID=53992 RepID=A0AA36HGM9_CYLNA|nr:unnamed protein product [Cylicocyclus nassatus]